MRCSGAGDTAASASGHGSNGKRRGLGLFADIFLRPTSSRRPMREERRGAPLS